MMKILGRMLAVMLAATTLAPSAIVSTRPNLFAPLAEPMQVRVFSIVERRCHTCAAGSARSESGETSKLVFVWVGALLLGRLLLFVPMLQHLGVRLRMLD
jgi:hypothetical protein